MHHIAAPEAVRATLAEMVRVARPGGWVLVWDHNPRNPYWKLLMKRVPQDTGDERLIPERELLAGLRAAGAQVRVVDRTPTDPGSDAVTADGGPRPDQGVSIVLGDLRDPAIRDQAVTGDLTGIVHLAAFTSVLGSIADPAMVCGVNVEVTAGLLELARRRGVNRFIMASTNAVTGDVGDAAIHEDMPPRPLTPYGATKAAAEMLMSGYAGAYAMVTCALRLTNVYGAGMSHKDSFIPRLMRAAVAGATVQVYGDGRQRRDLVHVDDVTAGLLAAWHAAHTGPLIIGSGRSHTVLDIIDHVEQVTGHRIRREHVPAKPGEMPAVIVSIDRARALGYQPSIDLPTGLRTVWDDVAAWT
jgi:UDP-glucose 4-epimerase